MHFRIEFKGVEKGWLSLLSFPQHTGSGRSSPLKPTDFSRMDWESLLEEIETEYDWPDGADCLKSIEKTLRCPICHATMRAPVLLSKCGHSFCSYCIRQTLGFEQKCPLCKKGATESDLVKNITVTEISDIFKENRSNLLELARRLFAPRVSRKRSESSLNASTSEQPVSKRTSSLPVTRSCSENNDSPEQTDSSDTEKGRSSESSVDISKASEQDSDSAFEQE